MFKIPFLEKIKKKKSILIAGAGGGFDIYSGIPLYFALKNVDNGVYMANTSFVDLELTDGRKLFSNLYEIDRNTLGDENYFPEKFLSQWFYENCKIDMSIYCLNRVGVKPMIDCYKYLIEKLSIDAVVLVDGGTDSLMKGNETGLGTPEEDIVSIVSVNELRDLVESYLACLGFGVDVFHGVCHAQFLEGVSELIKSNGFLGSICLQKEMDEVKKYMDAVTFSMGKSHPMGNSIVSASVLSSIEGNFGDYHKLIKTKGSKLWINPLMSFYWFFDLSEVANRLMYREKILSTMKLYDVKVEILKFRGRIDKKTWDDIPL